MTEPSNPNLHPNIFPWIWSSQTPPQPPKPEHHDDESWEVRAFAEDTSSATGTTWPPRSYTCAFCRREFRSAQALGGHMNVHRRDRARLQMAPTPPNPSYSPMQVGFFENRTGFCLVCQQLGNPVHEAEQGCVEKGEEDDEKVEVEVSEVELDLELRLGN